MVRKYILIKDVLGKDYSWVPRDFLKGEIVYGYSGATYGCISAHGIAITEKPRKEPFLELPRDSLELVVD
jgi:hypothetical protein